MKKSIIAASAASLALAAMPVVSTFAATQADPIVDNLNLTISSTCSLTRAGGNGTASGDVAAGTWNESDVTDGKTANTYYGIVAAGKQINLGKSTFTFSCNDNTNGYRITATASGLISSAQDDSATMPIKYAATAPSGKSYWNITVANVTATGTEDVMPSFDTTGVASATGGIVQITAGDNSPFSGTADLYGNNTTEKTRVVNGHFTADYNVYTVAAQAVGTYTGSATYTLTYGA